MRSHSHRVPQNDNRRLIFILRGTRSEMSIRPKANVIKSHREQRESHRRRHPLDIACCWQLPKLPLGQPTLMSDFCLTAGSYWPSSIPLDCTKSWFCCNNFKILTINRFNQIYTIYIINIIIIDIKSKFLT